MFLVPLASSLGHGHEAVAMPAIMNEAKKSYTNTIIKFMLVQAASGLCLLASRARQVACAPRTPDDMMTISPPSDFRHILHVGAGDARGITALQQMVAMNEMVSSSFNLLHTVQIDSRLCVSQRAEFLQDFRSNKAEASLSQARLIPCAEFASDA